MSWAFTPLLAAAGLLASAGGGVTATPGTASLTITTYAPTVTVTNNQTVTPGVASLTLTTYAPTVTGDLQISAASFTTQGAQSASSITTASVSPTAKVYMVAVNSRTGISTDPNVPTLSGWGITWNQIATAQHDIAGSSRKRITLFWGYNASPSSGTLTADFSGQTQTDMGIVVDEITNADTSSPIVQSVTATDDTITVSTLTATLAAFADADNATYSAGGIGSTTSTFTPGTGFTTVSNLSTGTSNRLSTQFRSDNDTSVDMSWSANEEIGIIAVEIAEVTAGTTVTPGVASLTLTTFAPTVTATNNQTATPGVASLTLASFAPVIKHEIRTGLATLTLSTFAPTVSVSNNQVATPGVVNLTLTTFAPTVTATANQTVTPGVASLTLSTFAPTVTATDHKVVTPDLAALTLSTFAPTVTVAAPGVSTLIDNFNDNSFDTSKWSDPSAGALEQNQRLEISNGSGAYTIVSATQTYDVDEAAFAVQISDIGPSYTSQEVGIRLYLNSTNIVWIFGGNGNLVAYQLVAGSQTSLASATYSATNHKYLRIRESGGTFYFDYSADGTSWTNLTSTTNNFGTTIFTPQLYTGQWQGEAGGGYGYFDDVNLVSVSVTPGVASLALTTYAPTVTATNHQTVTPGVVSLVLSPFAPTVTASDHKTATPGVVSLTLTTFAPTVTALAGTTVTPDPAALVLTGYAPTVVVSTTTTITPDTLALVLTTYAPTVTGNHFVNSTPGVTGSFNTQTPTSGSFTPQSGASGDWIVADPDPSGTLNTQSSISGSFTPQS